MDAQSSQTAWSIQRLSECEAIPCPCGSAKRAFTQPSSAHSLHLTTITKQARTHYHRAHTETYYILQCNAGAMIELDGEQVSVQQGDAIRIPPFVRHRAIGELTILNIVVPPFDPADEYFD